jgi:hypothetical protein
MEEILVAWLLCWRDLFGIVGMILLRGRFPPAQDDAAGYERQSAKEHAINSVQLVPTERGGETPTRARNAERQRKHAECPAERRARWFVHENPSIRHSDTEATPIPTDPGRESPGMGNHESLPHPPEAAL